MKVVLNLSTIVIGIFTLFLPVFSTDVEVEHKPVSIAALQEIGMFESGVVGEDRLVALNNEWVDHFGAFVNKEIVINGRLHLYGGLGGIFQFRKPEVVSSDVFGHQRKGFFIGPTRTEALFHFGDLEKPFLKLGLGMFGYKYNPEAANLGEYLFRTGTYPNYIMSGGYSFINNAVGYLQGAKALFEINNFKLDVLITTETGMPPLYDFSLAAVAGYNMLNGFIDIGAGFNMQRFIPVKPSRTTKEHQLNGYVEVNGLSFSTNVNYYDQKINFYRERFNALNLPADSLKMQEAEDLKALAVLYKDSTSMINYYTSSGTILMGRVTIDPKALFPADLFGTNDLKLYAEAALLGWTNYPVFYTKRSERMPVMFGFNVPTFHVLDLLALQFEYYNSSYLNNTFMIGNDQVNIPISMLNTDSISSTNDYMDITNEDNFKWSLLVQKRIMGHITLSFQAARDHIRPTSAYDFYGPQFAPNEFTLRKKDWYWMIQISWGL
jgi:hypothetical protein